jgi:hypothetical protein
MLSRLGKQPSTRLAQSMQQLKRLAETGADGGLGTPLFPPIPSPQPGDWLAEHPERGQTVRAYSLSLKK